MFCRRFSSCVLLIIIVLSISRSPIIANAAEVSAEQHLIDAVNAIKDLGKPNGSFKVAVSNIAQVLNDVNLDKLTSNQMNEMIDQILYLGQIAVLSADAVLVVPHLSSIVIKFYKSIETDFHILRKNENLRSKKRIQGLELLEAMKNLSEKISHFQQAQSFLTHWFQIAEEFKAQKSCLGLYVSDIHMEQDDTSSKRRRVVSDIHMEQHEFSSDLRSVIRNIVTKDHLKHILDGINFLVFRFDISNAQSVMENLPVVFDYDEMTPKYLETVLNIMKHLCQKVQIDVTVSSIATLLSVVNWEKVTPNQMNQMIDLILSLVDNVNSSADAVLVVPHLSSIVIKFYKSIETDFHILINNENLRSKKRIQGLELLEAMKNLSKKVSHSQQALLFLTHWFRIADEFKAQKSRPGLHWFKFIKPRRDIWEMVTENNSERITKEIDLLVVRIDVSDAESVMNNLPDVFDRIKMTPKYLETVLKTMEHLSDVDTKFDPVTKNLCKLLISRIFLTPDQVNSILRMLNNLMIKVKNTEIATSMIRELCVVINKHSDFRYDDETNLTTSQTEEILLMLQELIQTLTTDEAVALAKSYLKKIGTKFRLDCENRHLLATIMSNLDDADGKNA